MSARKKQSIPNVDPDFLEKQKAAQNSGGMDAEIWKLDAEEEMDG